MKDFFNKLLNFFIHFFRRILFFTTKIIFCLICQIIFIVTYEPKTWRKVTKRKIKRIRRLTNLKLWAWKYFGWYIRFIHADNYYIKLEERFGEKVNV